MEALAKQAEHSNLYYIFQRDQKAHPMPEDRAQKMLEHLRLLLALPPE